MDPRCSPFGSCPQAAAPFLDTLGSPSNLFRIPRACSKAAAEARQRSACCWTGRLGSEPPEGSEWAAPRTGAQAAEANPEGWRGLGQQRPGMKHPPAPGAARPEPRWRWAGSTLPRAFPQSVARRKHTSRPLPWPLTPRARQHSIAMSFLSRTGRRERPRPDPEEPGRCERDL